MVRPKAQRSLLASYDAALTYDLSGEFYVRVYAEKGPCVALSLLGVE